MTDSHPLTRSGRTRLHGSVGKYAGVVIDLFYDHLLAVHWDEHHEEPLDRFKERMYVLLNGHREIIEGRAGRMLPHMIDGDWLGAYATWNGLSGALRGLAHRASRGEVMIGAEELLRTHYDVFLQEFRQVLADVQAATTSFR